MKYLIRIITIVAKVIIVRVHYKRNKNKTHKS